MERYNEKSWKFGVCSASYRFVPAVYLSLSYFCPQHNANNNYLQIFERFQISLNQFLSEHYTYDYEQNRACGCSFSVNLNDLQSRLWHKVIYYYTRIGYLPRVNLNQTRDGQKENFCENGMCLNMQGLFYLVQVFSHYLVFCIEKRNDWMSFRLAW